jgi:hypothetical protein
LSRDLQPIHAKSSVNRLHLVLQISKIPPKILRLQVFYVYRVGTKQGLNPSRNSIQTARQLCLCSRIIRWLRNDAVTTQTKCWNNGMESYEVVNTTVYS